MGDEPIPNYERAFAAHPAVYSTWQQLNAAIRADMDLRRYELATLAAALAIRSSYCSLAHGKMIAEEFGADVVAIATARDDAGLEPVDIAVMAFAERVAVDAPSVTTADREALIELGLTQREVGQVVLTAAARCFFAKALDGLGAQPDAWFLDLDDDLRAALVVGTPIAEVSGRA